MQKLFSSAAFSVQSHLPQGFTDKPCQMSSSVALRNFVRARDLAKRLKVDLKEVTRRACRKENRVFYFHSKSMDRSFAFKSTRAIILPFEDAQTIANELGANCELQDVINLADGFDQGTIPLPPSRTPGI